MAARELFVWYRVRRDRVAEAQAAVAAMHRSLAARWPDLAARLLARDDGASTTWMEIYARAGSAPNAGIDAEIEASIADAARAIAELIDGERHVEAFAPLK